MILDTSLKRGSYKNIEKKLTQPMILDTSLKRGSYKNIDKKLT